MTSLLFLIATVASPEIRYTYLSITDIRAMQFIPLWRGNSVSSSSARELSGASATDLSSENNGSARSVTGGEAISFPSASPPARDAPRAPVFFSYVVGEESVLLDIRCLIVDRAAPAFEYIHRGSLDLNISYLPLQIDRARPEECSSFETTRRGVSRMHRPLRAPSSRAPL